MAKERTEQRRARAESATTHHIRGGLGVRKRLGEASRDKPDRLSGVQTGSVVLRAHDRYFADFTKGFDIGLLLRKTVTNVFIQWLGEDDQQMYGQGEAVYEVFRGRWKFLGPPRKDPLNPDEPLMDALTRLLASHKMVVRQIASAPSTEEPTTEEDEMSDKQSKAAAERAAAQKAVEEGSIKDRDTYTAKQVATRCGTDSKTMRKFFRSAHSTVEPVGQGGRYEFDANDLPKIKKEFDAWKKRAESRRPGAKNGHSVEKLTRGEIKSIAAQVVEEDEDDDISMEQVAAAIERAQDEDEGSPWAPHPDLEDVDPTEEDLDALEELDLDDLDAEEI